MMFEFSLVDNDTGPSNNVDIVDIFEVNGPVRLLVSIVANTGRLSAVSSRSTSVVCIFFFLINFFLKSAEPILRKLVFSF